MPTLISQGFWSPKLKYSFKPTNQKNYNKQTICQNLRNNLKPEPDKIFQFLAPESVQNGRAELYERIRKKLLLDNNNAIFF